MAGFLPFLSCEVSAFIICCISGTPRVNLDVRHLVQFSGRFDAVLTENGFRDGQTVYQMICSFRVVPCKERTV